MSTIEGDKYACSECGEWFDETFLDERGWCARCVSFESFEKQMKDQVCNKKRKFLDKINKEIDNYALLHKSYENKSPYNDHVEGMIKARTIYLRVYEGSN